MVVQAGRCYWCNEILTIRQPIAGEQPILNSATLDHIHPKSKGGTWRSENIVLACWLCNNVRGSTGTIEPESISNKRLKWLAKRNRKYDIDNSNI